MYTILRTPQTCELRLQVSLEQIRYLWELSYRPPAVNPPVQSMKRASDFPSKNIGVGYHVLLQGIFPTQKTEPTFPAWQRLRKWKWARLLCVSGWHRKPERDKGETKDAGPGTSCFLLLSSASRPHLTSRGCAQEPPTYHHYVIPAHWPSSTGVHTGKKIQEPGRRPPEPMTRGSLVARPPAPRKGAQACSWWVSFSPTSHALIVFEDQWGNSSRNRTEKKPNKEAARLEEKRKWEPAGLTVLLEGG
ncbi:uncharacterized protein LOC129538657 [Moschus berezovskii]|uniref:uncharacterized protein LOC129538657 n=1 Tax=Moschus berezovskii TaxID=68408 RepID=UPI002444FDCB|nr:uncharacterized protein LOC129538657 [Moschus berezovskii]